MKIQKINDNQVRFVLTGEDLSARQIRLSELAYGTEKARNLFREMLEQASSECGFHVDNSPLMIEAIPMRSGSIVLIVTKVDNPEELDTRFASFTPDVQAEPSENTSSSGSPLDQLIQSALGGAQENEEHRRMTARMQEAFMEFQQFNTCNRLYIFSSMSMAIKGAAQIAGSFTGESILFDENGACSLLLKMKDENEVSAMQNLLVLLTEYGAPVPFTSAREQYLREHGHVIIPEQALQTLAAVEL